MRNYGVYARLSQYKDTTEATENAVGRQVEASTKAVEARGGTVAKIYDTDTDISAYQLRRRNGAMVPLHRPDFERLLEDHAGPVGGVACFKLERLARNRPDFNRLWDTLQRTGAALLSVHESFDTATPMGEFVAHLLNGIAKLDSDNTSIRLKAQQAQAAQQGRPHTGGPRPYGYAEDRRTILADEAAVLVEAARRVLAGQGLRGIAADLARRGVRTVTGQPMNRLALRDALTAPRTAGLREHHGEVVGPGDWPPIVDRDTWERSRAILTAPGRSAGGRPPAHLLTGGLARCGHEGCGGRLRARPDHGRLVYICDQAGAGPVHLTVTASPLEAFVVEAVLHRLAGPGLAAHLEPAADGAGVGGAIADDERQLVELATAHGHKQLTLPEYLAARAPIAERISSARASLAVQAGTTILADLPSTREALDTAWARWDLEERRRVLAAVLVHVTVRPATRPSRTFDAGRVPAEAFTWRA